MLWVGWNVATVGLAIAQYAAYPESMDWLGVACEQSSISGMSHMDKQTSAASSRSIHAYGLWLILLTGCSALGCTSFASMQDLHYSWTNKHRASSAWTSSTTSAQRRELGSDYAKGFKQGFYDAATGRGCKTPAVPPPCYWSTKYQCCEGQDCIQNWFRGYQCGVIAAEGKGFPEFHDVPVSPYAPTINRSGCQGCYSPDYCECGQDCGGQCTSGQCSDDLHGGHPSGAMGSSYDNSINSPNVFHSSSSPSESVPQASFPAAPRAPKMSDEAVNNEEVYIDEGYVTQTDYQTSYEELFAKAVAEKPLASAPVNPE